MDILAVCICAIVAMVLSLTIKKYNPELSVLLSIGVGIIIFVIILNFISPVINQINSLVQISKIPTEYSAVLIKALGICFICQFSADACRDVSQTALATKVELAGKLLIVILALPMIEEITTTAIGLIGGG